jgi:hypothetical protein
VPVRQPAAGALSCLLSYHVCHVCLLLFLAELLAAVLVAFYTNMATSLVVHYLCYDGGPRKVKGGGGRTVFLTGQLPTVKAVQTLRKRQQQVSDIAVAATAERRVS